MTGAEVMALAVAEEGVRSVFGLMGEGNLDFLVALHELVDVAVYDVRHEGAAVAMADGYARATGNVGVATVTSGPGVTQLGTSLTVANRHQTPLVVVAGDLPTFSKGIGARQDLDQRRYAEASGALYHQLRGPSTVAADVQQAFWLARTRRLPVLLDCPIDVQAGASSVGDGYTVSSSRLPVLPPAAADAGSVERAADLLANARRPVLLAGAGAREAGAREAVESLGARVGAVLATTVRAKGWLDGPWSIGVCGSFSSPVADQVMADADLVLIAGSSAPADVMAGIPGRARTILIDRDAAATVAGRQPDCLVVGDARRTLEAIDGLLEAADYRASGFREGRYDAVLCADPVQREVDAVHWEVPDGCVDARLAMREFDRVLPRECTVVIGAGHFFSIPATYLNGYRSRRFLYTYDFGCIGQGLPTAIGVAAAEPHRPVVLFEGDASLLMHVQELETAGRYQPRLLVVAVNDGALGAEYHNLTHRGLDPRLALVGPAAFDRIAAAFGNEAGVVTSLAGIGDEVAAFMRGTGTRVVDLRITVQVVSRAYRKGFGLADS